MRKFGWVCFLVGHNGSSGLHIVNGGFTTVTSIFSDSSSPKPVKVETLGMVDVPPLNLATVLVGIQRNMTFMQQRADQANTSMATLRALIEEHLPPANGAREGSERH
ncbi:hypothetical protein RHMOL_Rhmol05G0140900 [Rhododendron molle]|uniref:Uncharacterized protein n=1 Tax=Rhododendron molle TaxID=49168 RepID=A0ACC0NP71_RHOML|nr:hypothetical protein RHMOL_Rhmol05G0140900 [Rhododendron molle]